MSKRILIIFLFSFLHLSLKPASAIDFWQYPVAADKGLYFRELLRGFFGNFFPQHRRLGFFFPNAGIQP